MKTSLLKTLAGKHDSTVSKMARKYAATIDTSHGPRTCLQVSIRRDESRKPLVVTFGGIPLQRQKTAVLRDRDPVPATSAAKSWSTGSWRDGATLRTSGQGARAPNSQLADLEKLGQPDQPEWMAVMARRRRKALVAAQPATPTSTKATKPRQTRTVTGEPGDRKRSRRVRQGGAGKGPRGTPPAPYLTARARPGLEPLDRPRAPTPPRRGHPHPRRGPRPPAARPRLTSSRRATSRRPANSSATTSESGHERQRDPRRPRSARSARASRRSDAPAPPKPKPTPADAPR